MTQSRPHRHIRRLNRAATSVVTINVRTSKVVAFWQSPNLITPLAKGFHVHAVSADPNTLDNYEKLASASKRDLHWQHSIVRHDGQTQLKLEKSGSYRFFITADNSDDQEVQNCHLQWPVFVYHAESKGDATVLAFSVPKLTHAHAHEHEDDSESDDSESSSDEHGSPRQNPFLHGFGAKEHESSFGGPRRSASYNMQQMLDGWARIGLIDGGAMIDTRGAFSNWKFACQGDTPNAAAEKPYGSIDRNHAWHYVLPDPKNASNGKPWTGLTLAKAIKNGEAVALTSGQTVMLAGDLYRHPKDMEDADRSPKPINIMDVFVEARAARLNSFANQNTEKQTAFAFVYMLFDVILFHDADKEGADLLDYLEGVSKGKSEWINKVPWKKIEATVDVIRAARGKTRYSEIHFLAQVLGDSGGKKAHTLEWMLKQVPSLSQIDPEKMLRDGGIDSKEMKALKKEKGFAEDFINIVASYGRYAELALDNAVHFSENWANFKAFKTLHKKALDGVANAASSSDPAEHPIPARSLFLSAFGCHYLTDGFSAGHLRVPRSKFGRNGGLAAKLMHDFDGYYGLLVRDSLGHAWRAFGDGDLYGSKLDSKQRKLVTRINSNELSGYSQQLDANRTRMLAAVAATIKQLLTSAYSIRESNSGSVNLILDKPQFEKILDQVAPFAETKIANQTRTNSRSLESRYTGVYGEPGPGPTVWEDLKMSTNQKITYLGKHMPIELSFGIPYTENHPPLFMADGSLNKKNGAYQIVIAENSGWWTRRALETLGTKYQGFILRLTWHGFEDYFFDDKEMRMPFDDIYFLAEFSKNVKGLEAYSEKKLLEIYYQGLPRVFH